MKKSVWGIGVLCAAALAGAAAVAAFGGGQGEPSPSLPPVLESPVPDEGQARIAMEAEGLTLLLDVQGAPKDVPEGTAHCTYTGHCSDGGKIGHLMTEHGKTKVGYEVGSCNQGAAVGVKHYCDQYDEWVEYTCTLCNYHYRAVTNIYWTNWSCGVCK